MKALLSLLIVLCTASVASSQNAIDKDIDNFLSRHGIEINQSYPEALRLSVLLAEDPDYYEAFPSFTALTHQLATRVVSRRLNRSDYRLKTIQISVALANRLSHDQIMSAWLQTTDFGANCHGIDAALRVRLDKEVAEAELRDFLTLTSLVRSPYTLPERPEQFSKRFAQVVEIGHARQFFSADVADSLIAAGPATLRHDQRCG